MDKRGLGILIALALIIGGFVWFLSSLGPNHDWRETYAKSGDYAEEPYGVDLFKRILENQYQDNFVEIQDSLKVLSEYSNALYFYVGGRSFYDSTQLAQLLEFSARGNHVFISSKNISYNLLDTFLIKHADTAYFGEAQDYRIDSLFLGDYYSPTATLYNWGTTDSAKLSFRRVNDTVKTNWTYIASEFVRYNREFEPISYSDSLINGIKIFVDSGTVTFFTTPMLFTNWQILQEENFDFANRLLSTYSYETLLWDKDRNYTASPYRKKRPSSSYNPLGYLLSFPSFKWAWYILLSMGMLLILFNLKRRQRVMPLHFENKNTSMAFVETVGLLFYQSKANDQIAKKDLNLLLYRIRKRYGLSARELDDHFIEQLARRAQVKESLARRLVEKAKAVKYLDTMSEEMLINFHQLIEEFFNSAK